MARRCGGELLLLAYEFDRHPHGLPHRGRYHDIPALFDEQAGLLRVPPVPVVPYVVGIGIFIIAAALISTLLYVSSHED